MLSLLVVGVELLGAVALEDFALALLVGLITGSYSSIFVATPILAMLKGKDKRMRAPGRTRGRHDAAPRPRSRREHEPRR